MNYFMQYKHGGTELCGEQANSYSRGVCGEGGEAFEL